MSKPIIFLSLIPFLFYTGNCNIQNPKNVLSNNSNDSVNLITGIGPLAIKDFKNIKIINESGIEYQIKGLRGLDIQDNKTGKKISTAIGSLDSKIANVYVLDTLKRLVLVDMIDYAGPSFYVIFDMKLGEEVFRTYVAPSFIFPFYGNILFCEFGDYGENKWYISDPFDKIKIENNLTKILAERKIEFNHVDNINFCNNFLIGSIDKDYTGNKTVFVSVSWDDDFNKVNVVPIVEELSGPGQYNDEIRFFPSGNWMVWERHQIIELDLSETESSSEILFHIVDTSRKTRISLPVSGGKVVVERGFYKTTQIVGEFVKHKQMGECFFTFKEGEMVLYSLQQVKDKVPLLNPCTNPAVDPTQIQSMDLLGIKRTDQLKFPIYRYQWSRDFQTLVCEDWGKNICVYNRNDDTLLLRNKWPIGAKCEFLEINSKGDQILTSYHNSNKADTWNFQGEKIYDFMHSDLTRNLSALCYYNNNAIFSANESGLIEFIDLKNGISDTFSVKIGAGEPTSIDYCAKENKLLIGCEYSKTFLYDINNRTYTKYDFEYDGDIQDIWFLDNPEFFLVSYPFVNETQLYNIEGKKLGLIPTVEYKPLSLNDFFMVFHDRDKLDKIIVQNIDAINKLIASPKENYYVAMVNNRDIILIDSLFDVTCILRGHEGTITHLAISPDGSVIVSVATDQRIRIWSNTGKLLNTLCGITSKINHLAYSKAPDYFYIATPYIIYRIDITGFFIPIDYSDKLIKGLDDYGEYYISLNEHDQPVFKALHDTNQTYAISEYDKQVKSITTHNVLDEVYKLEFLTNNYINDVVFSPDQQYFAILDNAPQVKVYSQDGNYLFSCFTHNHVYNSMEFSPHSKYIAISTYQGQRNEEGKIYAYYEIKIFDLLGNEISTIKNHAHFIFDFDDNYLLTFDDGVITRWKINPDIPQSQPSIFSGTIPDSITRDFIKKPLLTYKSDKNIESTAFAENYFWIAQSYHSNQIFKYSIKTNRFVDSINLFNQQIRLSADKAYLLSFDDSLYLFNNNTGELKWKQVLNNNSIKEASFTSDGKHIVAAVSGRNEKGDNILLLYKISLQNGNILATAENAYDRYTVFIRMINSDEFITIGDGKRLQYWDLAKFKLGNTLATFDNHVAGVEYINERGVLYIVLHNGELYTLEINAGSQPRQVADINYDKINSITLNNLTNNIYIATEHNVHVFDPSTNKFINVYCNPDQIIDGLQCVGNKYLAVYSKKVITCWDIENKE